MNERLRVIENPRLLLTAKLQEFSKEHGYQILLLDDEADTGTATRFQVLSNDGIALDQDGHALFLEQFKLLSNKNIPDTDYEIITHEGGEVNLKMKYLIN